MFQFFKEFSVLGVGSWASRMLDKCHTTELYSLPRIFFLNPNNILLYVICNILPKHSFVIEPLGNCYLFPIGINVSVNLSELCFCGAECISRNEIAGLYANSINRKKNKTFIDRIPTRINVLWIPSQFWHGV